MKIAFFGSTGNPGRCLLEPLLTRGHEVKIPVRHPVSEQPKAASLSVVRGDVRDMGAVAAEISGQDAVINSIGGDSVRILRFDPTDGVVNQLGHAV